MKTERNKTLKATHPFYLPLLFLPAGATSLSQLLFANGVASSSHSNLNHLNATVGDVGCGLTFPAANENMWLNIGQITHPQSE